MKKIMFAAIAALAITSCSQNEEFDAPSQNVEIGVGAVVKNTTRAGITNNSSFKKFTVYSYVTDGDYALAGALGTAYMNGVNFTYDVAWTNDATEKYYWPTINSGKKVQFFAYPTDMIDKDSYAVPETGYPSFTYTVAATSAVQKDLVVAHKNDMTSTTVGVANGAFQLDFTHALTRINFAFTPGDAKLTYTITSINVSKVKGVKGKYTFGAADKWDLTNATANCSYEYPITQATSKVENKNYFLLGDDEASLMLFPQDATGVQIVIAYMVKDVDDMPIFDDSKTITLPAESSWAVGQNILYTLTLPAGGGEVGITPNVIDWPNGTDKPLTPAN